MAVMAVSHCHFRDVYSQTTSLRYRENYAYKIAQHCCRCHTPVARIIPKFLTTVVLAKYCAQHSSKLTYSD